MTINEGSDWLRGCRCRERRLCEVFFGTFIQYMSCNLSPAVDSVFSFYVSLV